MQWTIGPLAGRAKIAPARSIAGEGAGDLRQRERSERIVPVHENRQRSAQRARIERRVRNTKLERIVTDGSPKVGELRRGEFRTHGRERRSACRERRRREA